MQRDHIWAIAEGFFRVWVCFNKESIHTNRRRCTCQKGCKLALPSGRSTFAARLLNGMGDIKNYGVYCRITGRERISTTRV